MRRRMSGQQFLLHRPAKTIGEDLTETEASRPDGGDRNEVIQQLRREVAFWREAAELPSNAAARAGLLRGVRNLEAPLHDREFKARKEVQRIAQYEADQAAGAETREETIERMIRTYGRGWYMDPKASPFSTPTSHGHDAGAGGWCE